jgi:molybdate transport system substrate-binding protein
LARSRPVTSKRRGNKVALSFGSSGNFARQIPQGAPFDLFLSADEEYIFRLAEQGLLRDQGQLYAIGRLALLAPHGSPLKVDSELRDLAARSADGRLQHLAIANPQHAPYGRAARAVLERAGLWAALQGSWCSARTSRRRRSLRSAVRRRAASSPGRWSRRPSSPGMASRRCFPSDWHPPLRQRMALTRHAGEDARRFYDYLQQPTARAVFERYGFRCRQAGCGDAVSTERGDRRD